MDLRDMISQVGLNISLSPRYWLEKYSVLWDMLFGLGAFSLLHPSFIDPLIHSLIPIQHRRSPLSGMKLTDTLHRRA